MRFVDLTGKQFGNWVVLRRTTNAPNKMTRYLCRCSCGNENKVHAAHLLNGVSTKCRDCYESRGGFPAMESAVRYRFSAYKTRAKGAGRAFTLTLEAFEMLVTASCFYCGALPSNRRVRYPSKQIAAIHGIDRMDNAEGYIQSNCVPCCKDCNFMKKNHSFYSFIDRCKRIAERHGIRLEKNKGDMKNGI